MIPWLIIHFTQWDGRVTFNFVTVFPSLDGTYKLSLFNPDHQIMTTKEGAASESITFDDKEWETTDLEEKSEFAHWKYGT